MPIEVARQAESIARCGSRRVVPMPICLHAKANAAHASAMAAPLRRVYIHWVTPARGGAMWVLALRLTKLLWCAWFLSIRLRGLAFPGWTLRMVLVRPINCFPCFLLSLSIFVIFGIDETWPVALRIATVFQRFVA